MSAKEIENMLSPIGLQRSELAPDTVIEEFIPPYELDEIMLMFGDIFSFINNDGTIKPKWETDQMGLAHLPFRIPLSFCPSIEVDRIYCHKKLISTFTSVFQSIQDNNLRRHVTSFSGCYIFRGKFNNRQLSAHSWGIAIDLNAESNEHGTRGSMHPDIVDIFKSYGFEWGGSWKRKDKNPMHFQWCKGY
jgi:hypothetical protein